MIVLVRHQSVLQLLGLSTLEQVRNFQGEIVKVHGQRKSREILRVCTVDESGKPLVLYLKRTWRAHLKDGFREWWHHGQVRSIARTEWENCLSLQKAGLKTAPLVAYGEECGWFGERFSFLMTESVPCDMTLQGFLENCHSAYQRRRVLDALAHYIRRMHDAGLASPDLFTRHIFVDAAEGSPSFYLIDMARLDHAARISVSRRARDLAALNVTAPMCTITIRERLRFLHTYEPRLARALMSHIILRMRLLLRRRKHADYTMPRVVRSEESVSSRAAG